MITMALRRAPPTDARAGWRGPVSQLP
jgi:hypothetical protein